MAYNFFERWVMKVNSIIYNPIEEYKEKYKEFHQNLVNGFFEELVSKSNVDIEQNRKTIIEHCNAIKVLEKIKRKLKWMKVLRVIMCITIIFIPLVIFKVNPKIKSLKNDILEQQKNVDKLYNESIRQMKPLNNLLTNDDSLNLIEKTIPGMIYSPCLTLSEENYMKENFDYNVSFNEEESTLEVLSGRYNNNPFVFEKKLIHKMGTHIYYGYKTIHWTESYYGSDGKRHTRTCSQTLHATLIKPKPYFNTLTSLSYCSEAGDNLSFSREANHYEKKDTKEIEKIVKKGEKKLKKITDEAIKKNSDFMAMSNTVFEVLFEAYDRTDEVQFRTLFSPLAQTNMVELLKSNEGYGDDFKFIKNKRTNIIISEHNQNKKLALNASDYYSNSFDIIKKNFISKNINFFKSIYFDFAPLFAIPIYQEEPSKTLEVKKVSDRLYSSKEYESLVNRIDVREIFDDIVRTPAIYKAKFLISSNNVDEVCISAFAYDIIPNIEYVTMLGGDGRLHSVPVHWDEYILVKDMKKLSVTSDDNSIVNKKDIKARNNHLCVY